MELRLNKDVLQRLLTKTCWLLLRKLHKRTGKDTLYPAITSTGVACRLIPVKCIEM